MLVTKLEQWSQEYQRFRTSIRSINPIGAQADPLELGQSLRKAADDLKESFIAWLNSESFREVEANLLEELSDNVPTRVLIQAKDPLLSKLPWHLWPVVDQFTNAEIGFSFANFRMPEVKSESVNGKVRILVILGDSTGIDVKADRKMLKALPNTEVKFLVEPRRQKLSARIWEQPWDILFFSGHSETVEAKDLRYGLKKAVTQGLQLAIFNSC